MDDGSWLWSWSVRALYGSGSVILFALLALYLKQDSLLYYPTVGSMPQSPNDNPDGYRSPKDFEIPFENVMIRCADNVQIHAWLLLHPTPSPSPRPTVIFFHGNAGNIGFRLPNSSRMYHDLDANVLQVEYRGYGNSERDRIPINESGLNLDADAALAFVESHPKLKNSDLLLFGRSLGGAVAISLAGRATSPTDRIKGIIVENTFTSIPDMVDSLMPLVAPLKGLILRIKWDSRIVVPTLKVPILFFSGDRDELVPQRHMLELYELAKGVHPNAVLHRVKGGMHNDTWLKGGDKYWSVFRDFVDKAIGRQTKVGVAHVGVPVGGGAGAAGTPLKNKKDKDQEHATVSIPIMPTTGLFDMVKEKAL